MKCGKQKTFGQHPFCYFLVLLLTLLLFPGTTFAATIADTTGTPALAATTPDSTLSPPSTAITDTALSPSSATTAATASTAPQDLAQERSALLNQAEQGNAEAQLRLGIAYLNGSSPIIEKDEAEAIKWLEKAATSGLAKAQTILGKCYYVGQGVEQDFALAQKWLKTAMAQQDEEAQSFWQQCGPSIEQVLALKAQAESGNLKAQLELADMYDKKESGLADPFRSNAEKWYAKAAAQGDADAQFWLYRWGKADEQLGWFKKAIEQNHPEALFAYGLSYASEQQLPNSALNPGKSLTPEQMRAEALMWYRKAADRGLAQAEGALCVSHILGWGGATIDRNTAEGWCKKAAAQGKTDVLEWLVKYPLLREKAEQGNPEDQYELARMFRFLPLTYGIIGGVQEKETLNWYVKAMEQGHKKAEEDLAEVVR